MKIVELLKQQKKLADKMEAAKIALAMAQGKNQHQKYRESAFETKTNSTYRVCLDVEFVIEALKKQIEKFRVELKPVNDKLNAIELMLHA